MRTDTPVDSSQQITTAQQKPDLLLRMARSIEARYEAENGFARVTALRLTIVVGLVVYNTYNITSIVLLPDILWLSIAARVLGVTMIAIGLMAVIGRLSARQRERAVLSAMIGANLLPVGLFWLSESPYASYTVGEFGLTLAYGNMLLCLRFRHAIVFTGVALVGAVLAFYTKPELEAGLRFAFSVQIASACIFTLYANYRTEWQRCTAYLTTLEARLRSEFAESASREFEDMSRTDALTGLYNRRALGDELERWFDGSRRASEAGLAVLMIDIDHFKPFNDHFGHPEGDRRLVDVAGVLRRTCDAHDALCTRFGGEEFIVVLFDVAPAMAKRVANALARNVGALRISHPARPDGKEYMSISIGIAIAEPGHQGDVASLLAAADAALYTAKENGRDRIEFADGF